jgi:O-antigen/teichoic acid export membrane protein
MRLRDPVVPPVDAAPAVAEYERQPAHHLARKAANGALFLVAKSTLQQVLGFGSMIIVARLIAPEDLGLVALSLAIATFLRMLTGGQGMCGGLIRRPQAPSREDLASFVGLQLVVTTLCVVIVALAAAPLGTVGQLTAIMVAALPLSSLRGPGGVILERQLAYQRMSTAESGELLVYYSWTIATVAAGWGVWGLATATVAREVTGTALVLALAPRGFGFIRPRFDWRRARSVVGIGVHVQAVELIAALQEQVVLLATAALTGFAVVGQWSIVTRLMRVPSLVFDSVFRVMFPTMSRLQAQGDAASAFPKLIAFAVGVIGLLLAPLAGAAPALVPALFGAQWTPASYALPVAALGFVIIMPTVMAGHAYLWALGEGSVPLRGTIVHSLIAAGVGLALVSHLGPLALAVGVAAASAVHAAVLARGIAARLRFHAVGWIVRPTLAWVVACAPAWVCANALGATLTSALLGSVLALVLFPAALAIFCREISGVFLKETRPVARGVATRLRRPAAQPALPPR